MGVKGSRVQGTGVRLGTPCKGSVERVTHTLNPGVSRVALRGSFTL